MSVDTPAGENPDGRSQFACGICCGSADGADGRFLATYPSDHGLDLSPTETDGLLALCDDCAGDVGELTAAWTAIGRPPVGDTASIAESYEAVTDECSFCDGAVDGGPVLGLESWTPSSGEATNASVLTDACDDHDTYGLCGNCVAIFEEFLLGITPE